MYIFQVVKKNTARRKSTTSYSFFDAKLCLGSDGAESELSDNLEKLISLALADSTWKKYCTGWRAFIDFQNYSSEIFTWPLSIETMRKFTVWCLTVRKVSSGTVKSYFTSINLAHSFKNLKCTNFSEDKIINLALAGAKNLCDIEGIKKNVRRSMNIPTLLIISHRIATSDWDILSKQLFWAVCTLAFYTSVRLGEILSKCVDSFDKKSTLCWNNVKFLDRNEVLLFIPSTKTSKCKGEFLDVFPTSDSTCPVNALRRLMAIQLEKNVFDMNKPVFIFSSGKCLTTRQLNQVLKDMLSDLYEPGLNQISCHSFRSALPTFLNTKPNLFTKVEIQQQGRWKSDSYQLYLKLHRDSRRELFNKIRTALNVTNK
jgi:integrase